MAWVSLAMMAVSAMSAKQKGDQEAQALQVNAASARTEGYQRQVAAKYETEGLSKEKERTLGEQRANYGAAGVSIEGTPLEVMARTAAEYEKDILLTGFAGDVKANEKMQEADILEWMARQKTQAGIMGAGSSMASGFGSYLQTK